MKIISIIKIFSYINSYHILGIIFSLGVGIIILWIIQGEKENENEDED